MQRERPAAVKSTVAVSLLDVNAQVALFDAAQVHHKLAAVGFTWHDAPVPH